MSRALFLTACLLGLAAVAWVANGFWGSDRLALTVTLVIAIIYLVGVGELIQFRRATAALNTAVRGLNPPQSEVVPTLTAWLASLPESLRDAVQLRIQGERVALPTPVLTPYFVGLLVMLGLLGTFVGMVVTLKGAVFALEGTTELQAIRAGLAAPIKGLGLAFGTSVAGVAASAMLGLAATLCRRERQLASQGLDSRAATVFQTHSLAFQRHMAYQAIQQQSQALPALVTALQQVAERVMASGAQLDQSLSSQQAAFHGALEQRFHELSERLAGAVQGALVDAAQVTAQVVTPMVNTALADLQQRVLDVHQHWQSQTQQQLAEQQQAWLALGEQLTTGWQQGLAEQAANEQQRVDALSAHWAATSQTLQNSVTAQSDQLLGDMTRLVQAIETQLQARQAADQHWQAQQVAQQTALEASVSDHLQRLAAAWQEPLNQVIDAAMQAPRAAADLLVELQARSAAVSERDNQALHERQALMQQLEQVLTQLNSAALQQQQAMTGLVEATTQTLHRVNEEFAGTVSREAEKLTAVSAELTASLLEAASFGSAFDTGVQAFSESSTQLTDGLQQITQALTDATARSDQQMAYYVAQAREVIDLSLLSQKAVLNELRQWSASEKQRLAEVD